MRLLEQKKNNLAQRHKKNKLDEFKNNTNEELSKRAISIAKTIGNLASRLGKQFSSAPDNKKQGLMAALLLLNQAQSLVEKDANLARKLLSTARNVAGVKDDE